MDSGLETVRGPLSESLESALDGLSQIFFWPIVVCVLLMFAYALLSLGSVLVEAVQRRRAPGQVLALGGSGRDTVESMELEILRQLEGLRLCSRVAPMLGLVATMIPLGPALVSLSSGDTGTQTQTLGHSFSVVILALLSASVTFCLYTIRRRWLLAELHHWLADTDSAQEATS